MTDTAAPPAKRKLDDVLLAMDVVDTLRHRDDALLRELDAEGREEQLLSRLREIYAAQGIDVPDHVLKEGVKALEERRFLYVPPERSLSVSLAELYVSRDKWLAPVVATLSAIALGLTAWQVGVVQPNKARAAAVQTELTQTLPAELAALRDDIQRSTESTDADRLAETYYQEGIAAAEAADANTARAQLLNLKTLKSDLAITYDVKVVYGYDANGEEKTSAVIRGIDDDSVSNYYLVVEAISLAGAPVLVPITSEETGATKRVSTWGQRVSEEAFWKVVADKQDDAIIQNNVIATKASGALVPTYTVESPGGAIFDWSN